MSSEASAANAPNPPNNFSIQAVSDDQINLSWSAPYDGGFPITGYVITYVVDNGSFVELDTIDGNITNYSHTNLVTNHIYFYQVSAINSVGQSIPTKFLSGTTLHGTSVPDSPTSLQANPVSPTSVFLYWNAPQNNDDSIITGYMIEYGTITNQWHVLVSNTGIPQTSYYHSGIDAGKNYNYRVSAINSNGVGNPSNVVSIVPEVTTSPTITSIVINPTQVTLSWIAPSYTYGERIIGYAIDTKIDDDVYEHTVENTGLVTSYTISGLTTDKTYTFRLIALFDEGTRSISSRDVSVIPTYTSYYPFQTQNNLPIGTSVYTGQQSPHSTNTVVFSNPGTQTQYFQSPNTDIDGIWANVSTYVDGAVLYFDSEGKTYSLAILPNSKTWISFNNPIDVSNVRLNIDDRLYSSDIGRIAYVDLDTETPSPVSQLPIGTSVYTGHQSPGSLNTVVFSNPGPQTKNFQFPDTVSEVNGIWATVSTYVDGAVLYFDSEGKTYSLAIHPNSNTWISFNSPTTISNTIISIDDRGYSSDVGSVSYVTPDVTPQSQSAPDVPLGLHANLYSDDTVQLTWVSPLNNDKYPILGYRIEYKTNSDSDWNVISQNNGLQTIFVHSGLLDNKTYTFRVSSMNIYGISDPSINASVTTGRVVQPTPTNTYTSSGVLPIFNTDTSISYVISGGKVFGVVLDRDATSLDFMLEGETAGTLYTQLSRTLIDAIQSDESDRSFFVTVDGVNAQFTEIKTDDYRNMVISFPSGTNNISIIGTSVVPEFGTIDKEYVLPEPGTTPDSFVYGFKKAFEGLDLSFTFNQNDKVSKHLKFAELRLSEAKAMVQKGMPELVDDLTKDYEKQVSGAKQIANSASASVDKAALTETIMLASSKHIQVLTSLKDTLPEQAQLRIQVIIDNSKKDIGIAMKESSNRAADAMVKSEEMKKIAEYNKP
ncbi:fibronectin type III domain-containing protein [Candidatus Nitrosopumilus koreensis AR1]|uniref:Fibronectin type III domain-containing protein n=1 Tax=Candidatus Nitrosopumilus koreensis AR1 TaxID=1229908 RepID=K0B6J4_9ARCH|nr:MULTISPECIES: fibronectin type III domain-containing protein [Nitrosopumilus]AFS80560.1 fibronectin type III domain-containing protein [Candidatus Nitrosopumilus koreensis AR1]